MIDPTPFEPQLPATVRAVIDEGRAGRGPAKSLFAADAGTQHYVALVRGVPEGVEPEVAGWLVGMATFADVSSWIAEEIVTQRRAELAPFVLEAFATGLRAGVPTKRSQWKGIELLSHLVTPAPPSLLSALPVGLASERAVERGVALSIARRLGGASVPAIQEARATATGKAKTRLDEALATLEPGGISVNQNPSPAPPEVDLLARLIASWGATFDPRLVPLIHAVGAEAGRGRDPLRAASKGELEHAWLAVAARKDPTDVDRLLACPWPGAWKTAIPRVEALGLFPRDPRIARALLLAERVYTSWGANALHRRVSSVVDWMSGGAKPEAILAEAWSGAGAAPEELLAEARAHTTVDVAALERAALADPAAPEARMMLADALQGAGDPRGEFIMLSSAISEGRADAAVRKRAAKLLDEHIDAWSGPLPGVDRASRRFERGYLAEVRLKPPTDDLIRSLDLPAWRTIERLHLELQYEGQRVLPALLPRAPSLRVLLVSGWWADTAMEALARAGALPPEAAALRGLGLGNRRPALETVRLFPSLTLLGFSKIELAEALELAGRVAGVTTLVFFDHSPERLVETLRRFDAGATIEELRVGLGAFDLDPDGWRVRTRRGAAEAELAWGRGRYRPEKLAPLVDALIAGGRRSLTVALPRIGRAAAEAAAVALRDARGITLSTDGAPVALWE